MTDNAVNDATKPQGTLALQTFSMPKDTNANGDIFGCYELRRFLLGIPYSTV